MQILINIPNPLTEYSEMVGYFSSHDIGYTKRGTLADKNKQIYVCNVPLLKGMIYDIVHVLTMGQNCHKEGDILNG